MDSPLAPATNSPPAALPVNTRVTTWSGELGTVVYLRPDGYIGVRLDGVPGLWEYDGHQLTSDRLPDDAFDDVPTVEVPRVILDQDSQRWRAQVLAVRS